MKMYGAIEAGGTKFVCAVADESLEIVERISIPTTSPVETLKFVTNFFKKYELSIISIGSFGPIDVNKESETHGFITNTPKTKWKNFDFVGYIKDKFNVPVLWTTDVSAAAYGEYKLGAGKGTKSTLYLTVGTGVGGGLVRDGQIVEGYTHLEMGHILVRKSSEDKFEGCCPFHGDCLEGLASGTAIHERCGKKGLELKEDDPVWDYISDYLAQAVMTYTLTNSPERIILGGGVMKQNHLLENIHEKYEEYLNDYIDHPPVEEYIQTPGLKDDAGIMGCLALAKDYRKN